ncbi:hypothetical protein SLA2020_282400 [Shorea laevis]
MLHRFNPNSCLPSRKTANNTFIDGHNTDRAEVDVLQLHGTTPLQLMLEIMLIQGSQNAALEHSNGSYGECIAEGYGELKAADAVKYGQVRSHTMTINPIHVFMMMWALHPDCLA